MMCCDIRPPGSGISSLNLAEVPAELVNGEPFADIHPTYRERLISWDSKWIAITVDGDLFQGYYCKDLFEDPGNREAFRQRYSYELAPPDTWTEYRDIAEFFTGRAEELQVLCSIGSGETSPLLGKQGPMLMRGGCIDLLFG